jgi:hypothetical protein
MWQDIRTEPEDPTAEIALSPEAQNIHTMSSSEHAALVRAIMLNFPEIYQLPDKSRYCRQAVAPGTAGPAIQPPEPAV